MHLAVSVGNIRTALPPLAIHWQWKGWPLLAAAIAAIDGSSSALTSNGGGSGMDVKCTLSGADGEHFRRF